MGNPTTAFVAIVLAQLAVAQTFVVDVNNGPGTAYTSIAAAVAAVPDGATLLVRPGIYGSFAIVGKGLTILAEVGTQVGRGPAGFAVEVRTTQTSQSVVVQGVTLVGYSSQGTAALLLDDCQGSVLIEDLSTSLWCNCIGTPILTLSAVNCAQLALRRFQGNVVNLSACNTVIEESAIAGNSTVTFGGAWSLATGAMTIWGGSTQIVGSQIVAGSGVYLWPMTAIQMHSSGSESLRILAPTTITAGMGRPFTSTVTTITQTILAQWSALRVDPAVVFNGPTPSGVFTTMPSVTSSSADIGGTITAQARGPVGALVILLVSLPGAPVAVPGFTDAFWLDPTLHSFLAFGTPQLGQPITAGITVPVVPALRGFRVAWQSVSFDSGSGFQTSNPSLSLVR